ncbi:uncharacterized protein LOC133526005 [Cydia pomonella]|uniref:uncharacterized protein LOC133526005 n=1 Tax=Cydia pomonella TaxID=82600 RepID=UPI002ADDEFB9|nr:uncharacterized protein LOC133526005 [Cydia pomonella]XP_061718452.1 uncharacterized protein LOC133526005 [Cydia pomonella]
MCYKGNFLHCIPIQWACLALGILNAIASVLLLGMYAFNWFLVFAMSEGTLTWNNLFGGYSHRGWIPEVFLFVIVPFVVLFNLICSIVLCNGICQRRPRQVKVFFLYGVGITILAALVSVMLLSCDTDQLGLRLYTDPEADVEFRIAQGLWLLFGCVLHSLFLVLVHQTHKKLKDEESFDHVRLQELNNTKKGLHV